MFLTDPLRFFMFLIGIGMIMAVFQCDGTINNNGIDLQEACKSGNSNLILECKRAGYW